MRIVLNPSAFKLEKAKSKAAKKSEFADVLLRVPFPSFKREKETRIGPRTTVSLSLSLFEFWDPALRLSANEERNVTSRKSVP